MNNLSLFVCGCLLCFIIVLLCFAIDRAVLVVFWFMFLLMLIAYGVLCFGVSIVFGGLFGLCFLIVLITS